ncbi:hypothetical protein MJO29_016801 [Puccinia striiformis f. sp. tritici]|nr:hypothetical protein MJO29_016801 [Puccinia striiformis f. sp. tritici]
MITQSQAFAAEENGLSTRVEGTHTRLELSPSITQMTIPALYDFVKEKAKQLFPEVPKELQIECVMSLIQQKNSFVLAGTGYGKSRIAEMYYRMFPKEDKGIVLVLNPLDSLGNNQVEEKRKVGIPAINLTKMNMTPDTEKGIMRGDYAFIYLSPEVLLNSSLFHRIFFSLGFRNRLILAVVDEAHMVYVWGLVASGKSKKLISHSRHQDRAVFRPSYGELGQRLLATNGIPLLLLSATCRPQAIAAILVSLKITAEYMSFFRGELARPEITIWRVPMKASLTSCNDLLQLFGPSSCIPDQDLVPTLIYSTTRHLTMQVLTVLNRARRIPGGQNDPYSTLARRYHSCTGELDKQEIVDEFVNKMIGRCGRGGEAGLAIMFVEENRRNGKNCVADFTNPYVQTDDDQMDALAITPVCLRVAFTLDNKLGYVPISPDNPNYLLERKREDDDNNNLLTL